ncbi:MAG TPA: hypothetical protein VFG55_06280 [Rhodanobacteraceae bacterium]|nr:hypothetical protein [Rhodanobacteraceae bacterium]
MLKKTKRLDIGLRIAALLCAAAVLGGCAFGRKIAYSDAVADVEASGHRTLALATHDQRPYVIAADKDADFVGLMRSAYGIPYNINTESGQPLADEMSAAIAKSLDARGFRTTVVKIGYAQSRRVAREALLKENAERLVLITLNEWKSDTYFNTSLNFDVKITVFDQGGSELASATFNGNEDIGKMPVPTAFRRKIEDWFSDPKIVEALR